MTMPTIPEPPPFQKGATAQIENDAPAKHEQTSDDPPTNQIPLEKVTIEVPKGSPWTVTARRSKVDGTPLKTVLIYRRKIILEGEPTKEAFDSILHAVLGWASEGWEPNRLSEVAKRAASQSVMALPPNSDLI